MRIDLSKDRYALNKVMEFDHVIRVYENGTVVDDIAAVWAPEVYDATDDDGPESIIVDGDGWSLERGWTHQSGYHGPVMHDSEFVGGALAEHILSTPGYWVVVEVRGGGWAVLHREV